MVVEVVRKERKEETMKRRSERVVTNRRKMWNLEGECGNERKRERKDEKRKR